MNVSFLSYIFRSFLYHFFFLYLICFIHLLDQAFIFPSYVFQFIHLHVIKFSSF